MVRRDSDMDISPNDYLRLVRYCASYTGHRDAAEDLVQQTLLEAWRKADTLYAAEAREFWLFGMARNVCRRWLRERSIAASRLVRLDNPDDLETHALEPFDIELELEREDLARLLDKIMEILPTETRAALLQRYIEELPLAEVARRFGITTGAVEARLHRGRLALRRVLTTDLLDDAIAHGLIVPDHLSWRQTQIWCPTCGEHKLIGRFTSAGDLQLDCPKCVEGTPSPMVRAPFSEFSDVLGGVKGFKPACSRVLSWLHTTYREGSEGQLSTCVWCGAEASIQSVSEGNAIQGVDLNRQGYPELWAVCSRCGRMSTVAGLPGVALGSPEGHSFWRIHGRIRVLPGREAEVEGSPTTVVGFESVASNSNIDFLFVRNTSQLIGVHGSS